MLSSNATRVEYIRRINLVLDYINSHLQEGLDLDLLADVAMFSKFHFHRIFKAIAGETVLDYIRRIRLEKAANLLVYNRDVPIIEIALSCGYSSQSNFSKAFKKHFDLSPTAMRESCDIRNPGIIESKMGASGVSDIGHISIVESASLSSSYQQQRKIFMEVKVELLPKRTIAYVRHIGPYDPKTIGPAYDRLCQWAGPRGLITPQAQFIGISWDNPEITPPENLRYDASITVPEGTEVTGEIGTMTLEASLYALYHCEIHNHNFKDPWNEFFMEWLPNSGYQPDDKPALEVYYNDEEKQKQDIFVVDLCLPVKQL